MVDHTKVKKKAYKIHYEPPPMGWFKDPKPDHLSSNPLQKEPDTFGLWDKSVKRPTTDRHFCPSVSTAEDLKESFLTCPPSVCVDPNMKALLESKPLVKSISGGRKRLELPAAMFTDKNIHFKETPLFAVTQHQSKLSLGNTAAMAQVCGGIQGFMSWLVDNWNSQLDVSTYSGSSVPGNRAVEPSFHAATVEAQISAGLISKSPWLFDLFSHLRDSMKLVTNGLHSSMEYNAATMVASSHLGREVVLSHLTENRSADWKAQLLQSKYNDEYLFGQLPLSSRTTYALDKSKGPVFVSAGDIPPQVSNRETKKRFLTAKVPTSSGGPSGTKGTKRSYPGQPFRGAGGGSIAKPKAQEAKVTPPPPPKPKSSKKGKFKPK